MIDSHTGDPGLGTEPLSERLERFRGQHDSFLSAVAKRASGLRRYGWALWCAPASPDCAAGVIFFNNGGYLGLIMWVVSACAVTGQSAWWQHSPL